MIKMKKNDMAIAFSVVVLMLGGVLVGLAGCQMNIPDSLDLGGTPTTSVDTGPIGGYGGYGGGKPTYVIADRENPDLTIKFGRRADPTVPLNQKMIEDTFADLHKLISSPVAGDDFTKIIATENYIDLISLNVAGYPTDVATSGYGKIDNVSYTPITENQPLRLIVVGVNSFNGINDNDKPRVTPHVVFQFKNSPGDRRMEETDTNGNGYARSEMQKYLMGNFLPGLKTAAGLTDTMLWAPKRKVANKGAGATDADTIEDTLWLPTVWEVFGDNKGVVSEEYEISENQVVFGYSPKNGSSWLASPNDGSDTDFCVVNDGDIGNASADTPYGCAPAFCVK